jgi:hypothetical protein
MKNSSRDIVNKFTLGQHLSDAELLRLRQHYDDVKVATEPFGERYVLMHIEAAKNLYRIEGYLEARRATVAA